MHVLDADRAAVGVTQHMGCHPRPCVRCCPPGRDARFHRSRNFAGRSQIVRPRWRIRAQVHLGRNGCKRIPNPLYRVAARPIHIDQGRHLASALRLVAPVLVTSTDACLVRNAEAEKVRRRSRPRQGTRARRSCEAHISAPGVLGRRVEEIVILRPPNQPSWLWVRPANIKGKDQAADTGDRSLRASAGDRSFGAYGARLVG